MKKGLLTAVAAVAALFCAAGVQAQEGNIIKPDQKYDLLQIGMLPGSPSTQDTAEVYGLRFGLPVCGGKAAVNGVDFAIIGSESDTVTGFQYATCFSVANGKFGGARISAVNAGKKSVGADIAAVNLTEDSFAQVGVVNFAKHGFQIGIINFMENGFLPCMPLFNFNFK